MPKPTQLPEWATSGTNVVEPTAGMKSAGFVAEQKPPAQYVNWLFKLLYDWTVWLNGLTNEALSWGAFQTFTARALVNSNGADTYALRAVGIANDNGIEAQGAGTGKGLVGTGGGSSGTGVEGIGGASAGDGVKGTGQSSGAGVRGVAGASGSGVYGDGNVSGYGVTGVGNGTRAPLRLVPLSAAPTSGQLGDLYVSSADNKLYLHNGTGWIVVGTQA